MSIDRYSSCPGGTGKKVKFCCADLVSDLAKVQRMLQGRQHVSCLTLVDQLDKQHPNRACLLACRLSLETAVGDEAAAADTLQRFVKAQPLNPIALAENACQQASHGDMARGLQSLQIALRESGRELPHQVFVAIGRLAEIFIQAGHMLPARGLLMLQASISGTDAEEARRKLGKLMQSAAVPVLFKEMIPLNFAPQDAPWRAEFDEALNLSLRGQWQEAVEIWHGLEPVAGDAIDLWRNLAVVRGFLGDYSNAAVALRKFADLTTDPAEAIEAEATAQLLTKAASQDYVDEVVVSYDVLDIAGLEQRLAADDRCEVVEVEAAEFEADAVPRLIYALLGRSRLTTAEGISCREAPQVLGEVLIFDADGDEPPRADLEVYRTQLDEAERLLREVAGDTLSADRDEDTVDRMLSTELAMSWRWRLPDGTSEAIRRKLMCEQRRRVVLEIWPELPMPLFDGQTPRQAAADPALSRKVQGAVLLLELENTDPSSDVSCDELRRLLNLPVPSPIVPTGEDFDVGRLPLSRLVRLDVAALPDAQLLRAFQRALSVRCEPALRRLSEELVQRESLPKGEYQLTAYQLLARFCEDPEQSVAWMEKSKQLEQRLHRAAQQREQELALKSPFRRGQNALPRQ
ncbi:MAG: hypothetical protein SGJ20_13830 [Planctomycetota bacterium]|nr:hypothetical protein [Planctomycetota bacterium]